MQGALVVLAAYLMGSISFAIVLSRLFALPDPRSYGSGNPGATNVLRTGSQHVAALTLLGDGGKGWLAVWIAALVEPAAVPYAGVAVFLGHLFPVFHGLKGGKGVATAAGVLIALHPVLGLGTLATFAVIVAFFRMISLASIIAAAFAVFWAWFLFGMTPVTPVVGAMSLLLIWRHHENIARLVHGKEPRIGAKAQ